MLDNTFTIDRRIVKGVAQWVARMTRYLSPVGSNTIKGSRCLHEQDTLPALLSTGCFHERFRA